MLKMFRKGWILCTKKLLEATSKILREKSDGSIFNLQSCSDFLKIETLIFIAYS